MNSYPMLYKPRPIKPCRVSPVIFSGPCPFNMHGGCSYQLFLWLSLPDFFRLIKFFLGCLCTTMVQSMRTIRGKVNMYTGQLSSFSPESTELQHKNVTFMLKRNLDH